VACERFGLDICGALVGMMSFGADGLCGIAGRLSEEEYDVGRRSHLADFSRAFDHLTLIGVACEICAAGAGAKRAAR
jgi:hypothetical protein